MPKQLKDVLQKYVRLKGNEIVIFPITIDHSQFKHLEPISAGQCIVDPQTEKVNCFGQSMTLALESNDSDTKIATKQFFG